MLLRSLHVSLLLVLVGSAAQGRPRLPRTSREVQKGLTVAYRLARGRSTQDHKATTDAFVRALGKHDRFLPGHSLRTSAYARVIARELGLDTQKVTTVDLAGRVHDLGKLGVSASVLRDASAHLSAPDWTAIHGHPMVGDRMLREIPWMKRIRVAASAHHESFGGGGYPRNLRGKRIPLLGRILAVADTFDAMTTTRTYHQALSPQQAVSRLRELAGTRLDPVIVESFLRALPTSPLGQAALRWAQRSSSIR